MFPYLGVEGDVPGPDEVRDQAGEAVPGRTDRHVGEVNIRDGQSLYGGGDRTDRPAREGLLDQDCSSTEASQDNEHPEQSEETSGGGDVG